MIVLAITIAFTLSSVLAIIALAARAGNQQPVPVPTNELESRYVDR